MIAIMDAVVTAKLKACVGDEEPESRAFLRLLADCCRRSPRLRMWLLDDFINDATTRTHFRKLVEKDTLSGERDTDGFAALADELDGWTEEKRRLGAALTANTLQRFGGLTWSQMETLVRRYEARSIDPAVFLLVRDWRKAGNAASGSPALLRRGTALLDTIIRSGNTGALTHLRRAVALFAQLNPGKLRAAVGYADWWKIHALLYMLRHPREAYRTREVRTHLAKLRLNISSLDFRRFCKRHGIRRDQRAGRPNGKTLRF